MKLNEIPQDGAVLLDISIEKAATEVPVEIDHFVSKGLVLKPILVDGKILNPEGSQAKISLIYERDGEKPLIWRNVSYGVFRQDKRPFVVLADKRDGVEFNRRAAFRLDMDVKGTLNKSEDIIIHDVSKTGISFYTSPTRARETGSPVSISFSSGLGEIAVSGKVIRVKAEQERVLHGCAIGANQTLDRFMAQEQIRRLRRQR